MSGDATPRPRILGSLRSSDGAGIVRIEDRFATDIHDTWSALTDPERLSRWLGQVRGDLQLGGVYRFHFAASGAEGTGRVEACEPPRHFVVHQGIERPDVHIIEATLTADGDQTVVVIEERGMPLHQLAGYGAGVQIHVEDLSAHLAGREPCDADTRMAELAPLYDQLAPEPH